MTDIAKTVFNAIFSFTTLFIVGGVTLGYLLIAVANQSNADSRACISAGMVKVSYNGTQYCAAPTNLVELKR